MKVMTGFYLPCFKTGTLNLKVVNCVKNRFTVKQRPDVWPRIYVFPENKRYKRLGCYKYKQMCYLIINCGCSHVSTLNCSGW